MKQSHEVDRALGRQWVRFKVSLVHMALGDKAQQDVR